MRELELDGIHDDGEHVLLVDSDGERYTLRIDKALRAAVRSDRPALSMIQVADSAPLRPREIQAMLRSGRSAEDIAEASEIALERVRRYEGPVLAEREWTAQRARTFPVGRGGPALTDVVRERLAAREATGDIAWDAWRRQDGTWTLELTFSAGGRTRQAHWVADLDNRSVSPVDDEARWISDEDAPPEPSRTRGRLQAVKSAVYDLEADGSLDGEPTPAPRARTWPGHRTGSEEHPSTIEDSELDALNARRGMRSVPRPDDSATVWAGLDEDPATETGSAAPAAATDADRGASAQLAPVAGHADEDAAEEPAGAAAVPPSDLVEDADHEAELEHSSVTAAQDPGAEDHYAPGSVEASEGAGSVDSEDSEDSAERASHEVDADEKAEDARGAARSSEDELQYQDTIDLTPLPGFDSSEASAAGSAESEKPAKKSTRAKSRRASMPSWDEIVFGSKHD